MQSRLPHGSAYMFTLKPTESLVLMSTHPGAGQMGLEGLSLSPSLGSKLNGIRFERQEDICAMYQNPSQEEDEGVETGCLQ